MIYNKNKETLEQDVPRVSQLTNQPNYEKSSLFHDGLVEGLRDNLQPISTQTC